MQMRLDVGREARLALAAVQFLTRIPVPPYRLEPDWLPRATRYFPLVGLGVGLAQAAVLLGAARLWSGPLPAILALASGLLLTGAFHEDGLADTADGFGGTTRERRLAIMADSRLGTFGVLALLAGLALQAAALGTLGPWDAAVALVAAGAGGRLAAVIVMAARPYAGTGDRIPHDRGPPGPSDLAIAALFGLGPLAALDLVHAAAGLIAGSLAAGLVAWRACRPLGGHTGDVLGATAVLFSAGFLLGAAARTG